MVLGNVGVYRPKTGDNEVYGLVLVDTAANRPAAGIAGRWFIASDTLAISYDTGAAWVTVGTLGGEDLADFIKKDGSVAFTSDQDFGGNKATGFAIAIEHHTAGDTLTKEESGSVHTNLGAGAAIVLTLPQDATAGCYFQFAVMTDGQQLRVDPGAAGAIYVNGAKQTDNKYIWADDEGESITLVADGNGDWVSLYGVGTWGVEA